MYQQAERHTTRFVFSIVATIVGTLILSSCSHASSVAEPTKSAQGLALAYAGCLAGEMDDSKNYSLYNLFYFRDEIIFGGVSKVQFAQGVIWKWKNLQDINHSMVAGSDYAIQVFAMASTIDSHWSRLSTLLNSAIDAGVKSWNKTHDLAQFGTTPFESQYLQLDGICKVINLQVFSYSRQKNLSPRAWTLRMVGQYLPPA